MKKLLFLIAVCFSCVTAHAQIMYGKPQFGVPGGMEGRNYAVIIKSDKNRRQQVEGMTHFLRKYGIVEKTNLDEINDRTSQFTVPFTLRQTQDACKGLMNVKYIACPIMLDGELRFEFYENGNMMMVIQNLSNRMLTFFDLDAAKPNNSDAIKEYLGEGSAVFTANSLIGKFLIWANVGLDNMQDFYAKMDDYFSDIDTKYKNYAQLVKEGEAKWMTPQEYLDYMSKFDSRNKRLTYEGVKKLVDDGRMPGVPEDRWEKNIRKAFDMLFIASSEHLEATIEGVAEDGEQTWENVDGKVLPIDPKLRKTYIKKGWTYTHNED